MYQIIHPEGMLAMVLINSVTKIYAQTLNLLSAAKPN